jgi:RNA polymerase sigma-70 factor (ECF subfamily)
MTKNQSAYDLYREAIAQFGGAIERLARAYEADPDKRRDLLQDIHLAIWRSFEKFEMRCSLRTWIYRVAHNTGATHVYQQRRRSAETLVSLQEMDQADDGRNAQLIAEKEIARVRLTDLIRQLRPIDRQLMLLYLEDMDMTTIAEIAGISEGNARVQIHRIKSILVRRFHGGSSRDK